MIPTLKTLFLFWGVLALGLAQAAETRDPATSFFDQSFGDFQEELKNARDQGKQGILLMFEQDECPYCHRMKQTVLNRADVQDWFKEHFLIFPVDIEGDVEIKDFQGRATTQKAFAFPVNKVRATPVFLFIDLDGKPIKEARFTGATSTPEEFLLLGRYVVEGAYKTTNFTLYKKQQQKR